MRCTRFLCIGLIAASRLACAYPTWSASDSTWNPVADTKPASAQTAPVVQPVDRSVMALAPTAANANVPVLPAYAPQAADHVANMQSDVFGAQLFTGAFSGEGPAIFNPDYVVSVGDRIQLRMWNGYSVNTELVVDAAGNVELPEIGPYMVRGVSNAKLQAAIAGALRRVFSPRVSIYAALAAAQPVRVYVTGAVFRPGMYSGTSSDSILRYLDAAGGIDTDRGSFREVIVKRSSTTIADIDLYDFLLKGELASTQLASGDVIFVEARRNTVLVRGLAENAKRFEFKSDRTTLAAIAAMAKPLPQATHVRVTRNSGTIRNVEYFPLSDGDTLLQPGDDVEFTADKRPGTITVRVEGEHAGPQEYVLPHGSRLGALLSRVELTEWADPAAAQLVRQSVKVRQKQLLDTALRSLESSVLTARSGTAEEAQMRKQDAQLVLQWVARAKNIEPTGQVMIAKSSDRDSLLLENGDVIRIPTRDGLVIVSGEVLFPSSMAYDKSMNVTDYIKQSGGYSQNADSSRIVVAHRDGSFSGGRIDSSVRPGDEILVLPKVDAKTRQFAKDIFQILFQLALSAKVVLGF
jgi:protein involved in polysaccharide export with SLBB domain